MEKAMEFPEATKGRRGVGRWLFAIGLLLFALAALAFAYDVVMAANAGSYRAVAAGELWFRLHPYSLNLSQAVVQRYLSPGLWDPLIVSLLQWPTWSLLGAPGAILAVLFYPHRKKEG